MTAQIAHETLFETAFWRPVRWLLLRMVNASARKVLLTRELKLEDGSAQRWLKADFSRFSQTLRSTADDFRAIAGLSDLPSAGNRFLVEGAVFTAAAYRALLRLGLDGAEARRVVSDIGWDFYAMLLGLWSWPFRLTSRDPGTRLRRTIRLLLWFPFKPASAPGYAAKVWVEGEDIYTYFTHCPPQSFVRKLISDRGDQGDLRAFQESWCRYDWPGADLIAGDGARGHYLRRRTLSHGDDVCDMCWAAKAKQQTAQSTRDETAMDQLLDAAKLKTARQAAPIGSG